MFGGLRSQQQINGNSRAEDLAVATFARVFGSARFEQGAGGDMSRTRQHLDQSTTFDKENGLVNRIELGVRSIYGSVAQGVVDQVAKDKATLRMTDSALFEQMRDLAQKHLFSSNSEAKQAKAALLGRVTSLLGQKDVAGSANFDQGEQQAIIRLVKTTLNYEGLDRDKYVSKISKIREEFDSLQFEKVRADAAFRWTGAAGRVGTSVAAKAAAIQVAPMTEFFSSTAGLGLLEGVVHQGIDREVMVQSKNWTAKQISSGLNQEIASMFKEDELGVSPISHLRDARSRYVKSLALLDGTKSGAVGQKLEDAITNHENALNDYIRATRSFTTNVEELEFLKATGSTLSAATLSRFQQLQAHVGRSKRDFTELGILTGDSPISKLGAVSVLPGKTGVEYQVQSTAVSNGAMPAVANQPDIRKLNVEANTKVAIIDERNSKAINQEMSQPAVVAKRSIFAMVSNWLAVAGAGLEAAKSAEALNGAQPVKVESWNMKLGDYSAQKFAEEFASKTGLAKTKLGEMVSSTVGRVVAEAGEWWNKTVTGDFAKQFEFRILKGPGGESTNFAEVAEKLGTPPGKIPAGYTVEAPPNPLAEAVRDVSGIDFSTGDGFRLYDFSAGRQAFSNAVDGVASGFENASFVGQGAQVASSTNGEQKSPSKRNEQFEPKTASEGRREAAARGEPFSGQSDSSTNRNSVGTAPTKPEEEKPSKTTFSMNHRYSKSTLEEYFPIPEEINAMVVNSDAALEKWKKSGLSPEQKKIDIQTAKNDLVAKIYADDFRSKLLDDSVKLQEDGISRTLRKGKIYHNAVDIAQNMLLVENPPIHAGLVKDFLLDLRTTLGRPKGRLTFEGVLDRIVSVAQGSLHNRVDGYCFDMMEEQKLRRLGE